MTYTVTNTFVDGTLIKASEVNANFTQAATAVSSTSAGHIHDGSDSKKLDWDTCFSDAVHDHTSDTEGGVLGSGLVPAAQSAFQIVQATTFTNQDYLAAELVNLNTGKNLTINTSTTTALFAGNAYILVSNGAAPGSIIQQNTWTNTAYMYDTDSATAATYQQSSSGSAEERWCGYTFTARIVNGVYVKARYNWTNGLSRNWGLQTYNGSTWTTHTAFSTPAGDSYYDGYIPIGTSIQGVRMYFYMGNGTTQVYYLYIQNLIIDFSTTGKTVNTGTLLTLDGAEKMIAVYTRASIPANTGITVDIKDGTNTISAQAVNTPINITSLASGSLSLIFNLSSSNAQYSPVLYGFGVAITK